MTHVTRLFAILSCLLLLVMASNSAQAAEKYEPPRLADGKPDLQGVWSNASLTRMTRGSDFKDLVIPKEVIDDVTYNSYYNKRLREDNKPTDPNAPPPTDGDTQKGYNNFWIDPGSTYGKVKGEYRSSWIISPKNGQIPYSPEGRKMRMAAFRSGGQEGNGRAGMFDGPEIRSVGDRCLISFGSSAGPPMNNVMYNNHYQFVQTPNHVAILVEMNHDTRIIDINGQHNPSAIKEWFGSSVGKWTGDTLVVETQNIHPIQESRGAFPLSEKGKVTERFTRYSETEMLYEFTVDDPIYYKEKWKGEMVFVKSEESIFEYACHEGNYALPGILAGARKEEREKAAKEKLVVVRRCTLFLSAN
ncbi:MAG: hypothetical protein ACRBCS_13610 [Cellvibrionaceae bacterium]